MYNFKNKSGNFKLHLENVNYHVNEKKKMVTATADVNVTTPDALNNTINSDQLPNGFLGNFWDNTNSPIKYTYTMKCSDNDVFDAKKGKKLALAALEGNAYLGMARRLTKWRKNLQTYLDAVLDPQISSFIVKAASVDDHNRKYNDSLVD